MKMLVTGEQMKATDAYAIHAIRILSLVLIEQAALKMALAAECLQEKGDIIWAVCGISNSGADGMTAARMFHLKGHPVRVFLVGDPDKRTEEFRTRLKIAGNVGLFTPPWQEREKEERGLLIDAVFGMGLSRPVEGDYRQCIGMLVSKSIRNIAMVDASSGIYGDTGIVMGIALWAGLTVTFGWEKTGAALYPGREYTSRVEVVNVELPGRTLETVKEAGGTAAGDFAVIYSDDGLKWIPRRPAYSDKGTFGKVLIMAGSKNMCEATYLSTLSACRTGAGLVELLTVEGNHQILQERLPEAIIAIYTPDQLMEGRDGFRKMIEAQVEWVDVVVLGPGLGNGSYIECLVEDILIGAFVPVIIGADGLNAIVGHPYLTSYYTESVIVTSHLGETARLTREGIDQVKENPAAMVLEYAGRYDLTCVLKDVAIVTTGQDGNPRINSNSSSAMVKASSSNMLTGIMAGLTAIDMEEEEAACLGIYLHRRAEDAAASKNGAHSLPASELADVVGSVMTVV